MSKSERIILIDADVISHFITGGEILKLPNIFRHKIKILDKVYAELERFPKRKIEIENLINYNLLEVIPFPEENHQIKKEYHHIKKMMFKGDGESACLAVARYTNDIIGSSNLSDIQSYCKMHTIDYLTTMDFLCEALKNKIMTESECNDFIQRIKAVKGKLPVNKMKDFKCKNC